MNVVAPDRETHHRIVDLGLNRPKLVVWVSAAAAILLAFATLLVEVDTDPENMLPADDPVRQLNQQVREDFDVHEMIVVGLIADGSALTPEVIDATDGLLRTIERTDGVIGEEVVSYETALGDAANGRAPAEIEAAVADNPLLAENVISADGSAIVIYVPLVDKGDANPVNADLEAAIADDPVLSELDTYIAGLPLAEEAFGEQMFIQMAIFAPLAALLIFILMLYFFKKLNLVVAAMIQAMMAVIITMGLLIGTGFTLHIMSSMIPIFLMPIAILDSIHVLSEFFDRYGTYGDRRRTLRAVYAELFWPLTFTSLTTLVAFASLALAPIPPVQVFGVFVAIGVALAWLLTLTFIPAYIMLMSEATLQKTLADRPEEHSAMTRAMHGLGRFVVRRRAPIVAAFAALAVVAVPGITAIEVNDNPVNWFRSGTEVRTATEQLNEVIPGTFNASIVIEAGEPAGVTNPETIAAVRGLQDRLEGLEVVGATTAYPEILEASDPARVADELTGAAAENQLVATLVTPELDEANVRIQLRDGDNVAMQEVVDAADDYLAANPLPEGVTAEWAGETYLNLVWQDKMVTGMLQAFLTTLVVVVVLMGVLFRSVRWALLGVLPVTWTILLVYGFLGISGKSYDMPIAVLSTLVLGIGVDFAIHFVQRFRELLTATGSPIEALRRFYEEPARALTRNAFVIAIGFTPLFLSSLTPYLVVGAMLSGIMLLSWLATTHLLPAIVSWSKPAPTADAEASETRTEPAGV